MVLLIPLITTIFIFGAFAANSPLGINQIYAYCLVEIHVLQSNFIILILGIIITVAILAQSKNFGKHLPIRVRLVSSISHLLQLFILGFFLAYIFLFVIAFFDLNIFSVILNSNPQILGTVVDKKVILNSIKNNDTPPEIVVSENDSYRQLLAIAAANTGADNYFGRYILPSVPGVFVMPIKKSSTGLTLVDNTLIISQINRKDLKDISSALGYLFVRQYFWGRQIKSYPDVDIMTQDEYKKFRVQDIKNKILLAKADVAKMEDKISTISADIKNDTDTISQDQDLIKTTYSTRDHAYSKCVNVSKISHTPITQNCQSILDESNKTVDQLNKNIDTLTKTVSDNKKLLSDYESYVTFFNSRINLTDANAVNIPHELGLFNPPNKIKMVLNTNSSSATADYLETLVHEYLHYASHDNTKTLKDSFFEEGLTEYFARNIIFDQLNVSTNLGYPVQVKIINEIAKSIPESKLADIYFEKDEALLETTLDSVWGSGFFRNNEVLFETLQFSFNPKQTLKLANTIMKHIGGQQLGMKDLYTTPDPQ